MLEAGRRRIKAICAGLRAMVRHLLVALLASAALLAVPAGAAAAWCTALGHTGDTYGEPRFGAHLLGGIRWAAGR